MQNYKNHIRFYPAHHFVFYPVVAFLFGVSIWKTFTEENMTLIWVFISAGLFLVGWLSFMLRQHYGMTMQNRTVVLEMRFRYYILTNTRFEGLEAQLSFGQIAALRFASDKELPGLVERALVENLSPVDIKKSIKHWLPDNRRV